MKAKVDRDLCTACGLCIDICPEVFELGSDGIAVAREGIVPAEVEETCRDAAEQCPVEAIKIDSN